MIRIDVDYNARDSDGRVVARVPEGQLTGLRSGLPVSLYDPVDHLWADATVAWIEPQTGAVGFEVDWTSFVDGDLPDAQAAGSRPRIFISHSADTRLDLTLGRSYSAHFLVHLDEQFIASTPVRRTSMRFLGLLGFLGRHEGRAQPLRQPLVIHYSIRLVPAGEEQPSSSSDVASLSTEWRLARR